MLFINAPFRVFQGGQLAGADTCNPLVSTRNSSVAWYASTDSYEAVQRSASWTEPCLVGSRGSSRPTLPRPWRAMPRARYVPPLNGFIAFC